MSFACFFVNKVPDPRFLFGVVVFYVKVCEQHDAGVGGQEDQDVPETVEVREAQFDPRVAQQSV